MLESMSQDLMEGRRQYLDALERRIEEWTARVEAIEARCADADPVTKADFEEKIEELWARLETARDGLTRLEGTSEEGWDGRRPALDAVWSDVVDAYGELYRALRQA